METKTTFKRVAIGAALGAVIMFFWGAFSHMVLLKGVGFAPLPNEDAVLAQLRTSVGREGLYFFPGRDFHVRYTPEQERALESKYLAGPTGFLVYHPGGEGPLSPRKLLMQFLSNCLAATIASLIVSRMVAPYWQRAATVSLFGCFGCLSVSTIYWNWYGFPNSFFAAQCVDQVVGWLIAGLAIAGVVPKLKPLAS